MKLSYSMPSLKELFEELEPLKQEISKDLKEEFENIIEEAKDYCIKYIGYPTRGNKTIGGEPVKRYLTSKNYWDKFRVEINIDEKNKNLIRLSFQIDDSIRGLAYKIDRGYPLKGEFPVKHIEPFINKLTQGINNYLKIKGFNK